MRIITVRRISQVFFFGLFLWFCLVSTLGEKFHRIAGWPVNWFLQLDPLAGLGTILSTHTLYAPLLWGLLTIILTILIGRFFCGWVCPFGSLHHFVGFLAHRKKSTARKVELNRYRRGQRAKYYILLVFLVMAAVSGSTGSLQTGLLDPIPLVTRSVNLVIVPVADRLGYVASATPRFYEGAWLIMGVFFAAIAMNFFIPRFYCRFICPLGALFGILNRFAIWRIGKTKKECINCKLCEKSCEGGCEPAGNIKISECILCFNCLDDCEPGLLAYQKPKSAAGEITSPDISRRGFAFSLVSGLFGIGGIRLADKLGANWYHRQIRPPGSLPEEQFLQRCIKCGQCMRVCPTNVIQPAGTEGGIESLWTPVLNNRIGSSGCQLNCVACGQVCPTSAIRPITLDEKLGQGDYADKGPIRLGTAFIDRNRCLPWAMDKPCIVCQENCPVSPKAIYTQEVFNTVRDGELTVSRINESEIEVDQEIESGKFGTGDYYCQIEPDHRVRIISNTKNSIKVADENNFRKNLNIGARISVQIRLQRPYIDIEKCIGCGVCEHECPVSGKKAIRVSAEGETRNPDHRMLLGG